MSAWWAVLPLQPLNGSIHFLAKERGFYRIVGSGKERTGKRRELKCKIQINHEPLCHTRASQLSLPDESKDLQVPSGLSMPNFMNCTEVLGLRSRLTPPTRAASHWPWRMAWKAFSKANKLEEQAVSMDVLGPGEWEKKNRNFRKNT